MARCRSRADLFAHLVARLLLLSVGPIVCQDAGNPGGTTDDRLARVETILEQLKQTTSSVKADLAAVMEAQTRTQTHLDAILTKLDACPAGQHSDGLTAHAPDQLTRIENSVGLLVNRTIVPYDCKDALGLGKPVSGVQLVSPDGGQAFKVYCDQTTDGGGWTVVQRRRDGSVDFYRSWVAYKHGFGHLNGEFWIGNDQLHRLTWRRGQALRIRLESDSGQVGFANYSQFAVDTESNQYRLQVSGYSGGASPGDAFSTNTNAKFSTRGRDHDSLSSKACAIWRHGGWWYKACGKSNLNGQYGSQAPTGLYWYPAGSSQPVIMKGITMMIRAAG